MRSLTMLKGKTNEQPLFAASIYGKCAAHGNCEREPVHDGAKAVNKQGYKILEEKVSYGTFLFLCKSSNRRLYPTE